MKPTYKQRVIRSWHWKGSDELQIEKTTPPHNVWNTCVIIISTSTSNTRQNCLCHSLQTIGFLFNPQSHLMWTYQAKHTRGGHQCWSESGLGLGLNGWVRVRTRTLVLWTRTRTRTPPLWTRTQALWTRTLVLWTRTRTRTPPRWTRTHSESRWVRWEMHKTNLNFHVQ